MRGAYNLWGRRVMPLPPPPPALTGLNMFSSYASLTKWGAVAKIHSGTSSC